MKRLLFVLMCVGLISMASAEVFTLYEDGDTGGNAFGSTSGFAVDVDTTFNAFYDVPLVAGQTYRLDSVSVYDRSDSYASSTNSYLSVYDYTLAGFDGDTSAEHLGHSDNMVDFLGTADLTLVTFNFANTEILVTADSDGTVNGAGSTGTLYFFFDIDQTRDNWSPSGAAGISRMNAGDPVTDLGAAIWATYGFQSSRSPEIVVSLTPVPEPATMALLGLGALVLRRKR